MARTIFFTFSTWAVVFGLFIIGSQSVLDLRPKHDKVVVCYVAAWAAWRPAKGQFQFENLQPELCTHLIYAFAGLNATTSKIRSLDAFLDLDEDFGKGTYRKMTGLRQRYPSLKITLAIGGWNEGSANYSALAASPSRRQIFVSSVIEFMNKYGFDGLDLDWEFPGARGGAPRDKENFSQLVKELSAALKRQKLLLTAAISGDKATIDAAYEITEISKYLDFIHLMAYDYHGAWDQKVQPNAPLQCKDSLCVESSIDYLLKLGAPAEKLVLGVPMYGRTFVLTTMPANDSMESPIGAPAFDKGFMGPFTRELGFMGYNEICKEILESPKSWRTGWYEPGNSGYSVNQDKVVVYDNPRSLMKKASYVKKMKLAGVMIWSIDTDDFRGDCAKLHTDFLDPLMPADYPLMRSINMALASTDDNDDDNNNKIDGSSGSATVYLSTFTIFMAFFFYA